MEFYLIFAFILIAGLLGFLSRIFQTRELVFGAFFILLFLGLDVLNSGYQVQNSFSTTQFNYTYYANSNTNEVSGMNITKVRLLEPIQDDFTRMFGFSLIAVGAILGFLGTRT